MEHIKDESGVESRVVSVRAPKVSGGGIFRSNSRLTFDWNASEQYRRTWSLPRSRELAPEVLLEQLSCCSFDYRSNRWTVLNDLIQFENRYMSSLLFLTHDIRGELLKNDTILKRSQTRKIFAYLPEIRNLHQHFRTWMDISLREWDGKETMGWFVWSMLEQPALMKVYSMFVNNCNHARALIATELETNTSFKNFIAFKVQQSVDKQSLDEHFLKPVGRLSRLLLQVREMIKYTPRKHPDRKLLEKCLNRAEQIVSQLDALQAQSGALSQIMRKMVLAKVPNGRPSQLLRCEDLNQLISDDRGRVVQIKPRRMFLTTELMICAKLNTVAKPSQERAKSSARKILTFFHDNDTMTVKWIMPLQNIDIQVGGPEARIPIQRTGSLDECSKMLHLLHDYATVSKIKGLAETLNNSFGNLAPTTIEGILKGINSSIKEKNSEVLEDELRRDSNWLQILPKTNKPQLDHAKVCTFQLSDNDSARNWGTLSRLAQLALSPENESAWWKDAGHFFPKTKPLFVERFATTKVQWRSEITCGCYFSPNVAAPLYAKLQLRDWMRNRNSLWICSVDASASYVTLYTHDLLKKTLYQRASFVLDHDIIECIVHVPEGQLVLMDESTIDTVWIGTKRKLMVYSAAYPFHNEQLVCVDVPGCPKRMLYSKDQVYVGLSNGTVLFYRRHEHGWDVALPLVVNVSCDPIVALLTIRGDVYVAAKSSIFVFGGNTTRLLETLEVKPLTDKFDTSRHRDIALMDCSHHGVWIVRKCSSTVSHYHPETGKHLQNINIADHVTEFVAANPNKKRRHMFHSAVIHVTALAAAADTLWIGTNVGITLIMALPRHGNVPVIDNCLNITYHGHVGGVTLLLPLLALPSTDSEDDETSGFDVADMYKGRRVHSQDLQNEYRRNCRSQSAAEATHGDHKAPEAHQKPATGREPETVLFVSGGRGYINWKSTKHVSTNASGRSSSSLRKKTPFERRINHGTSTSSGSDSVSGVSCTDTQIILWEKEI